MEVGSHLAPAAHRAAMDATNGTQEELETLLAAQHATLAKLDALLEAMRGWQSLSDMTVRLRSIIDKQEELARELEGDADKTNERK